MFKKIIFFLKYNNAVLLILAIIFLAGAGAFAASETGQEVIGKKETQILGTDNTLLLEADLENFDMEYKIEKIEEDEEYYYITYTYLDLIKKDNAWQYQLNEKSRKITKKIKNDLGLYLADELKEEYAMRIKDLQAAKNRAATDGKSVRQETVAYSGLIGKTLAISAKVFQGYEPVKKTELPSPTIPPTVLAANIPAESETTASTPSPADNLSLIYEDYLAVNDPDNDGFIGVLDNCSQIYNIDQADADNDGIGDACEESQISEAGEASAGEEFKAEEPVSPIEESEEDNKEPTEEGTTESEQEENIMPQDEPEAEIVSEQPVDEEPADVEIVEIN